MAERILENDLPINQVVRKAFADANEGLPGYELYIIEAMRWGLENEAAEWADGKTLAILEEQAINMGGWSPDATMRFLYWDESGEPNADEMSEEADDFGDKTHERIASLLLERLWLNVG